MDVGREIRRLREAKGWSQAKLAGAADMGVSGVSQIETGARNPSAVTLAKIAAALDVEVGELFPKAQSPLPLDGPRRASMPLEELSDEDLADVRRLLGGDKPQARFVEDDSVWLRELYAFVEQEAARRVEEPEPAAQRFSLLAEAIVTVVARWMQITARTDSRKTFGIVEAALDLEDQISTLLGDERRALSRRERSEITHIMGLLEEVARRHIARMEAELDQEPPADLEEFRRRKEQLREVRRRVSVTSA